MALLGEELGLTWTLMLLVVVAASGIYAAIILFSRLAGIRSHTGMSTFDFVTTVAIGAIVERVVLVRTSLVAGAVLLMAGPHLLRDGRT